VAREIGRGLQAAWGQPVVIDNRPGAGGTIGSRAVAEAAADGHTLLFTSASHAINPTLYKKLPYDTLKDFIGYVKANPGTLNYASQGIGSLSHVGTELFQANTGTDMTHVPYKGSGAAIADVLGGQVQVFMTTPPSVMQHVQAGKLKAYAVTGKARHPGLPNVPTTAEAGLPGFEVEAWVGLFAPAGTPPAVIQQLTEKVKAALATPEAKAVADKTGIEIRYMDPAGLANLVTKETDYWAGVIKAKNIKAD
jgi:tripartite-type tricarboxylate transporter receptor subunit TctC